MRQLVEQERKVAAAWRAGRNGHGKHIVNQAQCESDVNPLSFGPVSLSAVTLYPLAKCHWGNFGVVTGRKIGDRVCGQRGGGLLEVSYGYGDRSARGLATLVSGMTESEELCFMGKRQASTRLGCAFTPHRRPHDICLKKPVDRLR